MQREFPEQADTTGSRHMLDKLRAQLGGKSQTIRSSSAHLPWGCLGWSARLAPHFSFSGQKQQAERGEVTLFLVAITKDSTTKT